MVAHIEGARQARGDLAQARRPLSDKPPRTRLVGRSPQMHRVQSRIEMIAQSEAAVLIEGESGLEV
jgi:DNA-binding NtrC family response regulator